MDSTSQHDRARGKGVSPFFYWPVRVSFQLFFLVYFRLSRIGREHIPRQGPAIIASNHRSFFDPFLIACMARRPMYYVAKRELFEIHPLLSFLVRTLGAFPVDRGRGDRDTIATAKELLARGELVLIFPEGTRVRPGPLGASQAWCRPARARDRRTGGSSGDHRHRGDPSWLAHPPAQGPGPRRTRAALPARGCLDPGGRRNRH